MPQEPFVVTKPQGKRLPIVISVPHCGVSFPENEVALYQDTVTQNPEDTDWYVHELYDFVPALGITMIHAVYSRYVVDLNRNPNGARLYSDNRRQTGLMPTTSFLGKRLYKKEPLAAEVAKRRLRCYFEPYHGKIGELLKDLQSEFPQVLLWDAHSIKRLVPSIRPDPFPDLILGNQDGKTAAPQIIETALTTLKKGPFGLSHNDPFKGGYITRHWGQPGAGVHALQLEMSQDLYMDETRCRLCPERLARIRPVLSETLLALADTLRGLR